MGRLASDQGEFFYDFRLEDHVPADHLLRRIDGLLERVKFHSPETGFCVPRVKVRGHRELVTVLGLAASIQPGEFIQASGRWDNHREHGIQFKTTSLIVSRKKSALTS